MNTVQENINGSLELELGMQDLELDMQELEGMDAPFNWSNAVWSVATVSIGSVIVAT
ncbi:daptide-type RiPP [Kitasatospora sp. NPDC088346]|uniref:daptide-type RiPP n=1 Tax=Kitasatospora sp. NPDC088346 TaxID=3364073 RepID=UPI0038014391